jgi:GSH-dependent disulfide-bond oxidoreductase
MVLLLYTANTGNGRRATIMLEECGLPYSIQKVEIGKASRKPPELLAINPEGTIPTLVDPDGPGESAFHIRQSGAIILYLAEKTGRLLPAQVAQRAAILEWMMFTMTDVVGANTAMYQAMTEFPEAAANVSGHFRDQLIAFLRICDRRLGQCEYLAGAEYSVADVALYPVFVSRQTLIEETANLDKLKSWASRLSSRPAVKRALAILS